MFCFFSYTPNGYFIFSVGYLVQHCNIFCRTFIKHVRLSDNSDEFQQRCNHKRSARGHTNVHVFSEISANNYDFLTTSKILCPIHSIIKLAENMPFTGADQFHCPTPGGGGRGGGAGNYVLIQKLFIFFFVPCTGHWSWT